VVTASACASCPESGRQRLPAWGTTLGSRVARQPKVHLVDTPWSAWTRSTWSNSPTRCSPPSAGASCAPSTAARGRKGDPEYGIKRLLLRNREDLTHEQFAKLWNTMADDPALTDLHVAWITKEHLRDLLHTTPAPSAVRDRWADLLTWCADHRHVEEIAAFARTLDTWRNEIINTVLTGASNAGSEGINRIQKLDARAAFGYRNPENQRRRARTATQRSSRRSRKATNRNRLWVTGPLHHPG
jgi:hypothetical protein